MEDEFFGALPPSEIDEGEPLTESEKKKRTKVSKLPPKI